MCWVFPAGFFLIKVFLLFFFLGGGGPPAPKIMCCLVLAPGFLCSMCSVNGLLVLYCVVTDYNLWGALQAHNNNCC